MIEKILSAYRQKLHGSLPRTDIKRSAFLQVAPLEERATPAATQAYLLPVQPVQVVWIAPILPANAMTPAAGVAMSPSAADANVRTDLFCSSDCDDTQQIDVWEDWFTVPDACKNVPASKKEEPQPETSKFVPEVDLNEVRVVYSAVAEDVGAAE